jgi:hypothetical protein
VAQARQAFRAFRASHRTDIDGNSAASGSGAPTALAAGPLCCRVQLPIPHPGEEDKIRLLDEGEFPGGVQQRFRQLRPLVDGLLEGFAPPHPLFLNPFPRCPCAPSYHHALLHNRDSSCDLQGVHWERGYLRRRGSLGSWRDLLEKLLCLGHAQLEGDCRSN